MSRIALEINITQGDKWLRTEGKLELGTQCNTVPKQAVSFQGSIQRDI